MPCRRRQRSSPERETSGFRSSRTRTSRSSRGNSRVLRRDTSTASWVGVSVFCSLCGVWLRSWTLSRFRHFHTVCSEILYRSPGPKPARRSPGSPPAPSAASSPACEERSACSSSAPNLAQDGACHEQRPPARVYVIIRDGTPSRWSGLKVRLDCHIRRLGMPCAADLGIPVAKSIFIRLLKRSPRAAAFWQRSRLLAAARGSKMRRLAQMSR